MIDDDDFQSYEESLLTHDNNGQLIRYDPATQRDFDAEVTVWVDDVDWDESKKDPVSPEPDPALGIKVPRAVPATDSQGVPLLDGEGRPIPRATTVYDAVARKYRLDNKAVPIPVLCHQEHLNPVGVCRMCVVKVSIIKRGQRRWERKLLPACQLRVDDKMIIHTSSASRKRHQDEIGGVVKTLTKLLVADHLPHGQETPNKPSRISLPQLRDPYSSNDLAKLAHTFGVTETPFACGRPQRKRPETGAALDSSSPLVRVNHDECILCDRCVRACDTVKENLVIGRAGKGYNAKIAFDLDDAMGTSSCVACGECMLSCPTGALTLQPPREGPAPTRRRGQEGNGETVVSRHKDLEKRLEPRPERSARAVVPTLELLQPPPGSRGNRPKALELFQALPIKQLQWFLEYRSIVLREVSPGDILCEEGQYGAEAFILLSGRYEIELPELKAVATEEKVQGSFLEIPIPLDEAATAKRTITLTADQLLILGEMSCLNNQKRAATVRAVEDGQVLEVRRNVLYYLERARESREVLTRVYRERALANLVKDFKLFQGLDGQDRDLCAKIFKRAGTSPVMDSARMSMSVAGAGVEDLEQLLAARGEGSGPDDRITLLNAKPDQMVIRQGEDAREVFLIRIGHIKAVGRDAAGTERMMGYSKAGTRTDEPALVGEVGLLTKILRYRRWSERLDKEGWARFGDLARLLPRNVGARGRSIDPKTPGWDPNDWRNLCTRLASVQARDDLIYLSRQFPGVKEWASLKRFFAGAEWSWLEGEIDRLELMNADEFGKRIASCFALDDCELVRIPEKVFINLLIEVPNLFVPFQERTLQVLQQRQQRDVLPGLLQGQFLRQGLYNAQKLFAFDLTRCTRCDECTRACAASHGDGVSRLLREGLRLGDFLVGTSCRSCTDPYCMEGCPVDSIHRDGNNLNIQIESHCIGCGLCERNCPYGSIQMLAASATADGRGAAITRTAERVAKTCDLCENLIKPGQKTYCVYACPHDAAYRFSGEDLLKKVQDRLLKPLAPTGAGTG